MSSQQTEGLLAFTIQPGDGARQPGVSLPSIENVEAAEEGPLAEYSYQLFDLEHEELTLSSPIVASMQRWVDEYVARLPELGVFGSGDTEEQAVDDLRAAILDLHNYAENADEAELGGKLLWQVKRAKKLVCSTRARRGRYAQLKREVMELRAKAKKGAKVHVGRAIIQKSTTEKPDEKAVPKARRR